MMDGLKVDLGLNKITDPIVEPYPDNNKLLVLFELSGDVDGAETSNAIDLPLQVTHFAIGLVCPQYGSRSKIPSVPRTRQISNLLIK